MDLTILPKKLGEGGAAEPPVPALAVVDPVAEGVPPVDEIGVAEDTPEVAAPLPKAPLAAVPAAPTAAPPR